jgi:RHS repeat-associated protein
VGTGNGQFKSPGGVSLDSKGNVWVADTGNSRVQEFTAEGTYIKQFGSSGSGNGQFCSPWRLAVDPNNDQVWVADACNNRVQVFNSAGEYVLKFGSSGSGSGQFSSPEGIAFSPLGYVYILDKGNSRVVKWSDGAPSPVSEFGSLGSGNGQVKGPWGIGRDSSGNVWVTDTGNNRIEEFNSAGGFVRVAGTSGSGVLATPEALTVDSSNNVWVTDTGKNRVVEFNSSGEYIKAFGTAGTGNGQFKVPWGIAIDSANHVWVVDSSNCRVEEFNSEGTWMRTVGKQGEEAGNFAWPGDVATDSSGNVWVADPGMNRITEFNNEGVYIRQFGSAGSGNGQFNGGPWRITVDPNGHVWATDTGNHRVEVFTAEGAFIGKFGEPGSGAGQFAAPGGIALTPTGEFYITDWENNRIQKWSGASYWEGFGGGSETSLPATATSTIEYGVPVSGTGAPYALSSGEVAKWAQTDVPSEATAIFSPDETVGWPAADYKRATVDYFDTANRLVNVAEPGGAIATTEYNTYNDVVRRLDADNREAALKEGAKSAEVSQTLDNQSTYGSEGTELLSTLGPLHTVKLASGTSVAARKHAVFSYDEGAPSGGPYRLVTKETEGAQIAGEPEADVRTTTRSYAGQNNLGWLLREPTATRTDPSGLKLTHTTIYDPASGDVTETRTPAAGAPGEEILSGYVYKSKFGSVGSGNGQISKPGGVAIDKEGNVWVADTENNRIEEFSSGGTFVKKFGESGTANGYLKAPEGVVIDSEGHVWVADTGNNRVQEFSSTGTFLLSVGATGTIWGEFKGPVGITYAPEGYGHIFVADTGDNYVRELNMFGETAKSFGGTGTGSGQFSKPEGVRVDSTGNIWVADTGNNRVQEFTRERVFTQKFGEVGTGNGKLSKPEGIAVDTEGNVLVADSGNGRIEGFSSAGAYEYQFGSTGTGEQNMKTPAGLALDTSNNAYVLDTGNNRVQKWVPAGSVHESSGTGGTHGTQTIYYTAGENTQVYSCGEKPAWAGLPCEVKPAAQPETSGIPNLPVTTVTYGMFEQPLVSTETVGATTRTTTNTYDAAGRVLTSAVSSSVGTALPTASDEYSSETGALIKQSTTVEGSTKTIESVFNKLGEITSYKDADGNTSTYTYDVDGRQETLNDGKGTQTYSYDPTTGFLTKLVDSGAGAFTATHDVEGKNITIGYPNGMNVNHTFNAVGNETGVEYVKTTHCSTGCTWYSDSIVPSVHGQWLSQASTFSSQAYTYDAAGRLTKTQDTPAGSGCTTHIYAYDEETNITSLTTRAPGGGGACATEGGTVENRGYDGANRLNDSGISYDTFGDITKLPASDAGGTEVTSGYYSDETLASQSQNGQTIGYYLDPAGRPRQKVSTGTINSTVTSHFSENSATPNWTEDTGGNWTRNISGIGGNLVATQTNSEAPILEVEDLHGDVVGTAPISETATGLSSTNDPTEYGVPRTGNPPKYSWLGALQLSTELPSGVIAMGARAYVPRMGRFLQPDPVQGGSANAYAYTYGDPVNASDPTGEFTVGMPTWVGEFLDGEAEVATEEAIERAAEEQAAREEAEEKAREAAEEAAAAATEAAEEAGAAASGGGGKGKKAKGKKAAKKGGGGASASSAGGPYKGAHPGDCCGGGGKVKSKTNYPKKCLAGEVKVGKHCEKGPGKKQRPDPPIPPPSTLEEGEKEVETVVDDCVASGLCEI